MKVLLDTSALNWLADTPDEAREFFAARNAGIIQVLVTPEAATEIRNTNDLARLAFLEATLAKFFPLTPTRLPRLGAFRLGMGLIDNEADFARFNALAFLRDGQDRNLAANAADYRCDVFLPRDRQMSAKKKARLESHLVGTRILEPAEFLEELRGSRYS